MAIIAKENPKTFERELLESGMYIGRCYQVIEVGTIKEMIQGNEKKLKKLIVGFELPTEKRVFKEENGEQPIVLSLEFTLSLNEKSNLRKMLESWRGKAFEKGETEGFDFTKLIGATCFLNVIIKDKRDGTKYNSIQTVTPMMRGTVCPDPINTPVVIEYENFDFVAFSELPKFIKDKIESSDEYKAMISDEKKEEQKDGLPF